MKYLILLLFPFMFLDIVAKPIDSTSVAIQKENALKVYFDCGFCDFEHIKKEIRFINYVRDPADAQLFIIGIRTPTGSGGYEYIFNLHGQKDFENMRDTVSQQINVNSTDEERRELYTRLLKLALVRYALRTPLAGSLDLKLIEYQGDEEEPKDPWDSWVFSLSANLYANGESSYRFMNYWLSASANRVTEKYKHEFYLSSSYDENYYKINDSTDLLTFSRSVSFSHQSVKSLGNHFSAGLFSGFSSSIYSNYKSLFSIKPAIEYNFFPYSESNYKQIRLAYKAGYIYANYIDTTLYDKLKEGYIEHGISLAAAFKQKWGELNLSLNSSQVIPDFPKVNAYLFTGLDIRIFQGLSLALTGSINLINSQRSLSKSSVSYEERILKTKQLPTEYSYWTSIGLSYTFGSIYNNVVNPRFGY